jgi:tetrahydromethanopterin S-methyltransferase subunit F
MYFVFGMLVAVLLIIALSIQTAKSEGFEFIPANTAHIMNTVKELKYKE